MTTIEKIKTEIERLYNGKAPKHDQQCDFDDGYFTGIGAISQFIDTLESETTYDVQQYTPRPSVDIENVARVQFASHAKVFDKKRKAVFDWEQFKEVAGIFYGFGKKDSSDTIESEKPMNLDFEQELYNRFGMVKDFTLGMRIAQAFYDLGCRRTAEKYDEIEYNRQRAEEETTRKEFVEELDRYFFGCTSSITMPECYKACEHFAEWGAEHLKK